MRLCVMTLGIFFILANVLAENEVLDVQAFLPLFEKNSIAQKILDVRYSENFEGIFDGKAVSTKEDKHLVFDAKTRKWREEVKYYTHPTDIGVHTFSVYMWDGREFVSWRRFARKEIGSRILSQGVYENQGSVEISSQPVGVEGSPFVSVLCLPATEVALGLNLKLRNITKDTITMETELDEEDEFLQFEFSKKTGALLKINFYDGPKTIYKTYELSGHVECSGIWIPLRIVETKPETGGNYCYKKEYTIDPQTLRLLDEVKDPSIFNEALPAGCHVTDLIRKKEYIVTTADTLPNDVEAKEDVGKDAGTNARVGGGG